MSARRRRPPLALLLLLLLLLPLVLPGALCRTEGTEPVSSGALLASWLRVQTAPGQRSRGVWGPLSAKVSRSVSNA